MFYTIGNAVNYREAIQKHGVIMKLAGGYAFKTIEEAEEEILSAGKEDVWAVFGLDADWRKDVVESHDRVQHYLISDVNLIDLGYPVLSEKAGG